MKSYIYDHLNEFRDRLIRCCTLFIVSFGVGYIFADDVFQILTHPLKILWKGDAHHFIYTGATEVFMTYITVSTFIAVCITMPYTFNQIWKFAAPGLYLAEQKFLKHLLWTTPFLFFAGVLFAYFWVLPAAYRFFLSFEVPPHASGIPIYFTPRVEEFLSFVIHLCLAFGICFQFPVALILLGHAGLISSQTLATQWRMIVVGITAISALITPPDLLSMVFLILPLLLLYGIALCVLRILERKNNA